MPNTLVTISSTTYQAGSRQELSKTYTSDENGYVIFKQTIGEDVSNLQINVCRLFYELKILLVDISISLDNTIFK